MRASLKLFRIAGIDIGIHFTWIFIFVFFSWTLAQNFAFLYPEWGTGTHWAAGIITSLMLFVSVLIHELAHSLVAKARGLPVKSITLFILGGVSNLEEEPKKPGVEFSMAIVGPGASLVLALIFWLVTFAFDYTGQVAPVAAVFQILWIMNLSLGIFNLLPGFPLDGGRVLRSILWGSTGDLTKATNVATIVGQVFGWALIGFGIYYIFAGAIFSGIWIAFIGWFLNSAASASRRELTVRDRLSKVKVKDLMDMNVPTISPDTTVQDMVSGIFKKQHDRAVPVCRGNELTGIATITDVKKVPQERWAVTPVKEIMTGSALYTVSPEDNLNAAMELIARHDINQVLIKDGGRCGGLLTRADIIRYIQMSQELGIPQNRRDDRQP